METYQYHPEVTRVARLNDMDPAYATALLLPDDARFLDDIERIVRAKLFHDMYSSGLSLKQVGDIAGGLSKERVRQILTDGGYVTRPLPGSKRWRDLRRAEQLAGRV